MIMEERRCPEMMINICDMDVDKMIDKFWKDYMEPKWKPTFVMFFDGDSEAENHVKLKRALLKIGKGLIGDDFVLDRENMEVYMQTALYLLGHESGYPLEKGLFIWGKVGCGKTVMMKVVGMFAKIFNPRNGYRIEHCHEASAKFQMRGAEALDEFVKGSVCFDELGSEPLTTSYYGTQVPVMPMHIEKRYRLFMGRGRWTHFSSYFDL